MAFVAIPIQAIAQNIETNNTNEEEILETESNEFDFIDEINAPIGQEISDGVFIVQEDVSKRDQFEKHYLCSDGSYVSVSYPEAIHYLDENEVWQDVDQSLTYDSSTNAYINENTDFQVSFSSQASSTDMARIDKNGYTLSWGVQTTQNEPVEPLYAPMARIADTEPIFTLSASSVSQAQVYQDDSALQINGADRLISEDDSFALPKISSQIRYDDAFAGSQEISIKYTVYHNKIEEDIIIYKKGDLESVSMNMDVGALTPIVNSNGSVDLVDANNDMQFHIGIPYMIDAEHNVCNDIQVTAVKDGSNCIITYTPNEEWFNSSDRVFPILLDPSVTTNEYVCNMQDTYFEENSSATHSSEQLLYVTPNGNNNRRALIRITKLPKIEPSMPIISATLKLKFQSYVSDIVTLKAGYLDWGFDFEELNYQIVSQDSILVHMTHNTVIPGDSDITFDFSSDIYYIYNDEKYCIEHGEEYRGDFVIAYESSEGTASLPPFYSSENTYTGNRPIFTVQYGYTLPEGMLDGEIYAFQNRYSYSFMSVNGNDPTNNSNVYQVYNDTSEIPTTQKFKLEYVPSTGGYILRAVASTSGSGYVLTINRMRKNLASDMNVRISMQDNDISQEWLIIPNDEYSFRIVPRADMMLALTAYGFDDGTSTGTTATSEGNIFIQTFVAGNSYQEWYIYDNSGEELIPADFKESPQTDHYYITNKYNGKYLHRSNSVANCKSGTVAAVGMSKIKWHVFNLNDGYFVIRRSDELNYYLAPASNANGSEVQYVYSTAQKIPDICKWSFNTASGGGFLLKNKATGYYLYATNSTANPSSVYMRALYSVGTADYERQVWRFISVDRYVEVSANISFNDMAIDIDEAKYPSVNSGGATWVGPNDFTYTITSGSECVSYNSSTQKFIGLSSGTASVTATHKTTRRSTTFDIKVNKNAIIIVPGIMGSELVAGENFDKYSSGTKLWSDELTIDMDLIQKIASLECDNDGESVNDVVPYNNSYGTADVYKSLHEQLSAQYSDRYTIEFFAYDWRLSNAISAEKLDDFIDDLEYDKVVLIAHSMGGLVASSYLSFGTYQRNKVQTLITLGTPFLGTPTMPYVWGSEDLENLGLLSAIDVSGFWKNILDFIAQNLNVFDLLFSNFQSMYELFPTEKYFDSEYAEQGYLVTSVLGMENEYTTYSDTKAQLPLLLKFYKNSHANLAEEFHDSLYVGSMHVTELVNSYYIAGRNMDTLNRIEYTMEHTLVDLLEITWSEYSNTNKGDSVVVAWSASLCDQTPDRTFFADYVDHSDLISQPQVVNFVCQLIEGNTYIFDNSHIKTDLNDIISI